ncbi:MAG: tRNA pseudouridine(55) synthase TruB [Verrucomicrobia bacterium]|nr:tRNA pseudouridine(55) synthase TruB [Verrucomicrobiota bacterium]
MTKKSTVNISEGICLVDKPRGKTSFSLVSALRRITGIRKIGHAGTLDPFATGLMVMLIGSAHTKLSNLYISQEKEYTCTLRLGITTDTYDCEGKMVNVSDKVPSLEELENALRSFQGTILQTPPMFSAKKVQGQKLYHLARRGIEIERKPVVVTVKTTLLSYNYPFVELSVVCSKGTYVRSIAHDLGEMLGCGAHLSDLRRLRSGKYDVSAAIDGKLLYEDLPQP